ncbi:tol-pal system YbgF family protein [Streptomyces sp. NPDC059063]|uniref:tol-pal system YbgF family protein n=1 Tax=unclassified Streptomyces TaxID=2593676 RepID=UPI003681F27D
MDAPPYAAAPEPPPSGARKPARVRDPLAVALGNASLLGVGYLLLRRRVLALFTGMVSVVLVSVLAAVARPWCEVVVLGWWVAVVGHGWFVAGGRLRWRSPRGRKAGPVRGQRLVALGVTVPVLLAVGLLRYDAARIHSDVTDAREHGDCARVLAAQDRVWSGHRVADAPLTARGDRTVEACHRLARAGDDLTAGLRGDTDALASGFDTLAAVLAEPGNDRTVGAVLDAFLAGLPVKSPCRTVTVTDWLRHRQPSRTALDRSAGAVARTAPAALAGCGDDLMAAKEWKKARKHYQQLLDQYPGDARAPEARKAVARATLAIELAHVRRLLDGPSDTQPEYCSTPAKYRGAAPYRRGVNRALFFGNDTYARKLPAAWRTSDPTRAALVVCADEDDEGTPVRTCPYENKTLPDFPADVTFHKIAIPMKVYELRTGKRIADRKVQISGASCPQVLEYTSSSLVGDLGPPSDVNVKASKADVRAAFWPLFHR